MVLFPKGGLGRVLLGVIIITTISYLVLNLVSFGGNRWIQYVDVPVRFGLWRVCDTTGPGLCNAWANRFVSSITDNAFNSTKPGFVQSSQALEIISLVFYIVAAFFILIGILNLRLFPYERAFIVAISLLFICIVFLSATLGVMSVQGRRNRPLAFLDWAWWNGLVGLIMTIICWFSLICLIVYLRFSISSSQSSSMYPSKSSRRMAQNQMLNGPSYVPMTVPQDVPFLFTGYPMMNGPYYNSPPVDNSVMMPYSEVYPSMGYLGNMPMYNGAQYPEMYPYNGYYSEQSPSPMISELARQYINDVSDNQYERQLFSPYQQYYQDPYYINSYF